MNAVRYWYYWLLGRVPKWVLGGIAGVIGTVLFIGGLALLMALSIDFVKLLVVALMIAVLFFFGAITVSEFLPNDPRKEKRDE